MDDENIKVFSSSITRSKRRNTNNYKDLLQVKPATPVVSNKICVKTCNYEPKNDKFYIPKKKNGAKVKTVRDIRLILEKDVYSYLLNDLEKQENYFLQKIKLGCLNDPKLCNTAKKILTSDSPTSRTVWRMLMNINPNSKMYPSQFIYWNGKNIKIIGSKGGSNKYIHTFDISKTKHVGTQQTRKGSIVNNLIQKKALLQNSLYVKFKPGPLSKKKFLDKSYQKYNFGNLELVRLPKPGLEVEPIYGKFIPPAISAFLYHSFTDDSNVLTDSWANFAVSVLGTNVNGTPVQSKEDCITTYDLNYMCSQNRLLVRRDSENVKKHILTQNDIKRKESVPESLIITEVENVIHDILGAVEISLEQDKMYSGEDELRESNEENPETSFQLKDNKTKKRYICELDRLDVTVIRISENSENKPKACKKSYCTLGCICDSLSCNYNMKGHCGRIECMFQCTCDFSGFRIREFLERNNCNSFLPEVISKDKTCNLKLAKEEKKFRQTVIVTEDRSIVLKSRERDCKLSKKYEKSYININLNDKNGIEKEVCVMVTKLNCKDIEPFCMVHNLYKCFCEGKFLMSSIEHVEEIKNSSQMETTDEAKKNNSDSSTGIIDEPQSNEERTIRSLRIKSRLEKSKTSVTAPNDSNDIVYETCARTDPYGGRKYSNGYYLSTNTKIKEMEMNDITLQMKLNKIKNASDTLLENTKETDDLNDDAKKLTKNYENKEHSNQFAETLDLKEFATNVDSPINTKNVIADTHSDISKSLHNKFSNKSKLISWLETSYKQYKKKAELGNVNLCLGPPQPGKIALYPWDFVLSRFRERKNYFLVSNTKPYRLFMTINENNQFFASSININNIPWADIDEYPITVRNLLTNATDIQDNFFILFGLTHSWELVGSVTKVSESIDNAVVNLSECKNNESHNEILQVQSILKSNASKIANEHNSSDSEEFMVENKSNKSHSDFSKWFVMTIENDFSEIQFFKKGFFVKYESIMKAINVSKSSNKTVRLSSQKCNSHQSEPQFGIYAIPSENNSCVFIGPYEKDEQLGIETINTTTNHKRKRTRGIWITTKKIDNLRVIDNPLSFMPTKSNIGNEIPLHSHLITNNVTEKDVLSEQKIKSKIIKTLRPIRIGKTNGFYHLSANGRFHQISPEKSTIKKCSSTVVSLEDKNDKSFENNRFHETENKTQSESRGLFNKRLLNKPIAEIAPQVKSTSSIPVKKKFEGMFVLKPEEINKRHTSFESTLKTDDTIVDPSLDDTDISNDIENFLASYAIQTAPKEEIYIISDDEENFTPTCNWKYQYIICKNIKNLGWIHGRRNYKNRLSFEFPGFKETEFYSENEAFDKINQVLSRKVYVPKNITLEWCTVDDLSQIEDRQRLQNHELSADCILTKKGLCHKSDVIRNIKLSKSSTESVDKCLLPAAAKPEFDEMKNTLLKELEETSVKLEDSTETLLTEALSHKDTLMHSLGHLSDSARLRFAEKLQNIYSDSDDSDT